MNTRSRFGAVVLILSLASASLSLTGCMSLAMDAGFSQMQSPDLVPMQGNIQVGDYSVYKSFSRSGAIVNPDTVTKSRYEVIAKEGDLYVVHLRFVESSVREMEQFGFEYWVDKDGVVNKAFLLKGKGSSTQKSPMKIARKDESGYILYTDLKIAARMKNSTTKFDNIALYRADSFTGDANNNSKMVTYYSFDNTIPFQIVYGRTINEMNMVSATTSQVGNVRMTMYTKETESMATITKLVETGNTVTKTSRIFEEDYELIP